MKTERLKERDTEREHREDREPEGEPSGCHGLSVQIAVQSNESEGLQALSVGG